MTTEQEVINQAANEIAADIDFEILESIFKDIGWVKLKLARRISIIELVEMKEWLKKSCKGKYLQQDNNFLFQLPADATWFSLRWTS